MKYLLDTQKQIASVMMNRNVDVWLRIKNVKDLPAMQMDKMVFA